MSSHNRNTFCYRLLSRRSGIEPHTIDVLVANGFGSVHALLAMDLNLDLDKVPDVSLGQRSLLRSALKDIHQIHNNMDRQQDSLLEETREMLEQSLRDGQTSRQVMSPIVRSPPKPTRVAPKKTVPKVHKVAKKKGRVVNHLNGDDDEPSPSEKFGLRDRNKIRKRKLFEETEEGLIDAKTNLNRPVSPSIGDDSSCDVCCDTSSVQNINNCLICQPCYRFYLYHNEDDRGPDQLKCVNSSDNCVITKRTRTQCPSCRLKKCATVLNFASEPQDNGADAEQHNDVGTDDEDQISDTNDDNHRHREDGEDREMPPNEPYIELKPIDVSDILRPKGKKKKDGHHGKLCQVCGDKAKGRNYGIYSCNGCGIFFKRVQTGERVVYSCDNGNNCPITTETRSQCQYCRYQACLKAGMVTKDKSSVVIQHRDQQNDETESAAEETEQYASVNCGRNPDIASKVPKI